MSKVTYNRGERQKPTTPKYRDHYDKIDWSTPPQIPSYVSVEDADRWFDEDLKNLDLADRRW